MTPDTPIIAYFDRYRAETGKPRPKYMGPEERSHEIVGTYLGKEARQDGRTVLVIREDGERGLVWRELEDDLVSMERR